MSERNGFLDDHDAEDDGPQAFIQWKGTDVCLDLQCTCGEHWHFDGDFAYVLQCPTCGAKWEMPCYLYPRLSRRDDDMVRMLGDPT